MCFGVVVSSWSSLLLIEIDITVLLSIVSDCRLLVMLYGAAGISYWWCVVDGCWSLLFVVVCCCFVLGIADCWLLLVTVAVVGRS